MAGNSACIIPIKSNSTRVPSKNFRKLGDKELYKHVVEKVLKAKCFDDIYIDSDSEEIKSYAAANKISFIDREKWLAGDDANGNDLLVHHKTLLKEYKYYFQVFVTSPFMTISTIKECHKILINSNEFDSIFTVTEENGWFWYKGQPVNYRPGILPRSQDVIKVVKETTGLYGIRADSLERYNCRIGANPYLYFVKHKEAIDIDNLKDFEYAEYIWKSE